jgi:Phytanoyl-CoA dioxygenase (PhyH)
MSDEALVDIAGFERDGYRVLPAAVPPELCNDLVATMDTLLGVSGPERYERPKPFLDFLPLWGHPTQWAIRELPTLRSAWAQVLGTEDLLVSLDRCRFSPPWRSTEPEPSPLHWDHDPADPNLHYIQGAVALTDSPPGSGGFRCAPGWHHRADRWVRLPASKGGEWTTSVPDDDVILVPMNQGDVVLWTSRLPHSNSKNESQTPRYSFYVLMTPYDEELASELTECWRTGICQRAWRSLPGHDHAEPWAPVPLDRDARGLVGLDRDARGLVGLDRDARGLVGLDRDARGLVDLDR